MNLHFSEPRLLWLLLTAILPLLSGLQQRSSYPCVDLLPRDRLSEWIGTGLRLAGAMLLAALVTGLAGPYRDGEIIEKTGTGAQIVLLLDRSASMNQNFSGRYLGGRSRESKARYAQQFLSEFVQRRENDLFGMASFSTAPIYTLPFTQNRAAILAALGATSMKGRGITNIASGLSMALSFFDDQDQPGSRVILLISDGATRIDEDTRRSLAQWFHDNHVTLYWIYLRNPNAARLSDPPRHANETTSPEFFLHQYFQSLDIGYHAYEAEDPEAIRQAISDIEQLENKPVVYTETTPRTDLARPFFIVAVLLLTLLLAARTMEVDPWKS